jgi:hypothetical protein
MSNREEEAVAGPFEDIPVLIVVMIATSIFLFSMVHGYVNYLDNVEDQRMRDNAYSLSNSIRSYEELLDGSKEGVFLGEKVLSLTTETLNNDYKEAELGYRFRIAILDTSDYPNAHDYSRSYGDSNPPANGNIYSITTSILISVNEEYHTAQLIVILWS